MIVELDPDKWSEASSQRMVFLSQTDVKVGKAAALPNKGSQVPEVRRQRHHVASEGSDDSTQDERRRGNKRRKLCLRASVRCWPCMALGEGGGLRRTRAASEGPVGNWRSGQLWGIGCSWHVVSQISLKSGRRKDDWAGDGRRELHRAAFSRIVSDVVVSSGNASPGCCKSVSSRKAARNFESGHATIQSRSGASAMKRKRSCTERSDPDPR